MAKGAGSERLLVVTTNDGVVFTGADAAEIVRQMRNTEWGEPVLKRDYISSVLARVMSMTRVTPLVPVLQPARAEKFLGYLQQVGLITTRWEDFEDDEA